MSREVVYSGTEIDVNTILIKKNVNKYSQNEKKIINIIFCPPIVLTNKCCQK